MVSQITNLLKQIHIDGRDDYIQIVDNEIELEFPDISRQKVGELSNKEYRDLIMRLKDINKLSVRSVEYVKIARQKEKNRLSSRKYINKEKKNIDKLNEEIIGLRRYKYALEMEKMELKREVACYNNWLRTLHITA